MMAEASSENEVEILELAKRADDAKERAFLLLLLKINKSLDANTVATEQLAEGFTEYRDAFHEHRLDFQKHVNDEMSLLWYGRGAWKVVAAILSIAQVAAFAVVGWVVHQDGERQRVINELSIAAARSEATHSATSQMDARLVERIDKLERKVFGQ